MVYKVLRYSSIFDPIEIIACVVLNYPSVLDCWPYRAKIIWPKAVKGGGEVQPKFLVKLDFELAVDPKGGTHDRTFERGPNSQCRILRAGWPRPILALKYQICQTRSKTKQLSNLLVAIDVLSTRISFFFKLDKNGWVMSLNTMPKYGRDRQIL